jgi:hypothetical protein
MSRASRCPVQWLKTERSKGEVDGIRQDKILAANIGEDQIHDCHLYPLAVIRLYLIRLAPPLLSSLS